jgi:hypothetical protein
MSETASILEQQQQQQQQQRQGAENNNTNNNRSRQVGNGLARASSVSAIGGNSTHHHDPNPVLQALLREDKYLVERLVDGLGRCVLGLTENGRASVESRMYRRRIDAARRILEGLEPLDAGGGVSGP